MANILDLFTQKTSSPDGGDPTPNNNGVSEADGNDFTAVGNFFSQVASTYSTVKTALNDKQAGPASVPAQSTAPAAKKSVLPWVLGGAAVLLVLFLVLKNR